MKNFEEIEHTADRAFRVTGLDLAQLLENAANAMETMEGPRSGGGPSVTRHIEVDAVDRESLLVNWLNEILFLEQTCVSLSSPRHHHRTARPWSMIRNAGLGCV